MSRIPKIQWRRPDEAQLSRLQQWLAEYQYEQACIQSDPPPQPSGTTARHPVPVEISSRVSPFDPGVAPGQIRLFSARTLPEADRPVYIAVLSEWTPGWLLVAPYSRFSIPGTVGELDTGREALPLRALSLWNSHTMPAEFLDESWIIDQLTREELRDALAVFRHITYGDDLPKELSSRVGLPIHHPSDPRIAYQSAESLMMSPLTIGASEVLEGRALLDELAAETLSIPANWLESQPTTSPIGETTSLSIPANWLESQLEALAANDGADNTSKAVLYKGGASNLRQALESGAPLQEMEAHAVKILVGPSEDAQHKGVPLAHWDVSSLSLEKTLSPPPFLVWDISRRKVVGTGHVYPQDAVAILEKGRWADFSDPDFLLANLTLVVIQPSP